MSTQPDQSAEHSNAVPVVSTLSAPVGTVLSGGQVHGVAITHTSPSTVQQGLAVRQPLIAHIAHAGLSGHAPIALTPSIGVGVSPRLLAATGRLFTPIPAALSSSPLGAGPNSQHSAANIRHLALSSTVASSPVQRQLSFPGGMMVVPSLSAPRVISSGSAPQSVLVQPLIQGHNELQILRAQAQQQQRSPVLSTVIATSQPQQHQLLGMSPATVASATGSTIHHHGHSPMSRGASSLLTNPAQQQLTMSANLTDQQSTQLLQGVVSQLSSQVRQQQMGTTAQLQQRRASGTRNAGQTSPSATELSVSPHGKPIRTSPLQSPERVRKRLKIEEKPAPTPEIGSKRKLICDYKLREMARIKENYKENLTELFFLQNGGNLMEFFTWKKRPTMQLLHFIKSGSLDSDDEDDSQEKSINNEVKVLTTSGGTAPLATPVAISTSLPMSVAGAHQDQSKRPGGRHGMIFGHIQPSQPTQAPQMPGGIPLNTTAATTTVGSPSPYSTASSTSVNCTTTTTTSTIASCSSSETTNSTPSTLSKMITDISGTPTHTTNSVSGSAIKSKSPLSPSWPGGRPHSISAVYENAVGSQEAIVERAKQEAQVLQRVAELRKDGLWSSRRLPKVQEPARNKTHWDYLLEEMQWLAADFAQERKWKKAGARKIARMITRHFQELQQKEVKAEKEEGMKLKRIAGNMSKMVKEFWSNIEKVVQYKQQSRLDEKRKKALDLHLSFIVDQTEKYSSWLTEGLNMAGVASSSRSGSICSPGHSAFDDGDFMPIESGGDDEETIDLEEAEPQDEVNTKAELDDLQRENELPLEELLKTLPKEVLEKPASLDSNHGSGGEDGDDEAEASVKSEGEFQSDEEESGDDESTLDEQEKQEKTVDHQHEIKDLEDEGEMSIEELRKKYEGAYDSDFEAQLSQTGTESDSDDDYDDDDDGEEEDEDEEEEEASEEEEEMETEETEEVGIKFLTEDLDKDIPPQAELPDPSKAGPGTPNKEITDIAAAAQSIQPTGYTLETTQVKTKVPFLLKHTLREYQHVGLDWLATLHERKLNGILADEMGLGKTIQTIAVLAHLATEWGVWGPHLIVVPTSVMLNWELELKKWCPAFKILTYYGSQKERKLKRTGWTKTNAFHVCITSYKLVIQDHQAFRRKKWKYLILDEAQNIKNFKSQRWQTLLNFSSQRRLLLTGTPLQNSLMELWSLMHFLMPHVFQSHKEFKEWFANPLSGMIEGSREYNEQLIRRLHKVLRPFLLRRLKQDVEKQMPKKYEHVVMCRLSRRQRFLYDEFMAQSKTKETLASGHFMSVINILMQLRKVCNHPNLFDPRPILSPFHMEGLTFNTPSLVLSALRQDPLETIDLNEWYPGLTRAEGSMSAFSAHRVQKLQTPSRLIEEIDYQPAPEPRLRHVATCKPFIYRSNTPAPQPSGRCSPFVPIEQRPPSPVLEVAAVTTGQAVLSTSVLSSTAGSSLTGSQAPGATTTTTSSVEVLPTVTSQGQILAKVMPQSQPASVAVSQSSLALTSTSSQQVLTSHPITVQIHQTQQGTRFMIPSGSLSQLPAGFIQIVQTSSGQQLIAVTSSQPIVPATTTVTNGPSITVSTGTMTSTVAAVTRPVSTVTLPISSSAASNGKPVVKVSPMASGASQTPASTDVNVVKPTPIIGTTSEADDKELVTRRTARAILESQKNQTIFTLPTLEEKRIALRQEKLKRLATYNKKRCDMQPTYGQDLHNTVDVCTELPKYYSALKCPWASLGYVHCCCVTKCTNPHHPNVFWNQTDTLRNIVHTPQQYMDEMKEILDRFVFACPPVTAPRIQLHASHPAPSWLQEQRHMEFVLKKELAPRAVCLHNISSRMTVQFPELRLIEYDCGKLQTMDLLLARLKNGGHRVLIFTQMTRMLDVLEQFLSYHGHRYLRLDGTTKVEQRQILMDRFNMDKRIFCFILSTRSGGIGVNLTGADTVIFYDSDWNPTMDAQAQDRCHRIGQTRDVHIYRLVSEMTIEENILKKANQKRLLGDVAIEGGNFTAAFFKQNTIQELFEEPSGLQSLVKEQELEGKDDAKPQKDDKPKVQIKEPPKKQKDEPPLPDTPQTPPVIAVTRSKRLSERRIAAKEAKDTDDKPALTEDQFEQALCAAEEDTDIAAVSVVKAEQQAQLAEFDENIPWDEREAELKKERDEEMSKVEQELAMLEKELTPVERYAVCYMEEQIKPETVEELEKAEEEVTIAKEEWELSRLQALKEEDERRAELEEDEMLFTYARDDAYSQVKKGKKGANKHNNQGKSKRDRNNAISCTEGIIDREVRLLREKERALNAPQERRGRKSKQYIQEMEREMLDSVKQEEVSSPEVEVVKKAAAVPKRRSSVNSISSECSVSSIESTKKLRLSLERCDTLSTGSESANAKSGKSNKLSGVRKKVVDSIRNKARKASLGNNNNAKVNSVSPKSNGSKTPKTPPKQKSPKVPSSRSKAAVTSPKSSIPVPPPWSNPNLVIRTRRASMQSPPHSEAPVREDVLHQLLPNAMTSTPKASAPSPLASPMTTPVMRMPAVQLSAPTTPPSAVSASTSMVLQSTPVSTEPKKVTAGTYVIVSQGHNYLGQTLSLNQQTGVTGTPVRYVTTAGLSQQSVLQGVKQLTSLPQSVIQKAVMSTAVSQTSVLQTGPLKQATATSTQPQLIIRQAPTSGGPQIVQYKQLPQTPGTQVTQMRTVRQVTPSQLAQLRAMGHFKPGQHVAVRAYSPNSQQVQLRNLATGQPIQIRQLLQGQQVIRSPATQTVVSQPASTGQTATGQTVQLRTLLPGQQIIRTGQPIQMAKASGQTMRYILQQPGQGGLGQQVVMLSQQNIIKNAQGQQVIVAPHQNAVKNTQQLQQVGVSPQQNVMKTTTIQASQLAQLRAAMQQARNQLRPVQQQGLKVSQIQNAGKPSTILTSMGSPQKVIQSVIQTPTRTLASTTPRTTPSNHTVPILEKFAMQLAGGTSSILSSPASSPIHTITKPNSVLQTRPIQVLRTSNFSPISLGQVSLSNVINRSSTVTSAQAGQIVVQQLPKPVVISKVNGQEK